MKQKNYVIWWNSKVWCEKTTLGFAYRHTDLQKWIHSVWISGKRAWFVGAVKLFRNHIYIKHCVFMMSQTHFISSFIWAGLWPLKGCFDWDTEVKFYYCQIFDFWIRALILSNCVSFRRDYPIDHFAYVLTKVWGQFIGETRPKKDLDCLPFFADFCH